MDFLLSSELREFSEVLRKLFAEPAGKNSWTVLSEVGAFSAAVGEDAGGLGMGTIAAALVLEEAGRALSPLPLFEALSFTLSLAGDGVRTEAGTKLLSDAAEGKTRITGAILGRSDVAAAPGKDGSYLLSGVCAHIAEISSSHFVFVPARIDGGTELGLFSVEAGGLANTGTVIPIETFDLKRGYSTVTLNATPGTLVLKNFSDVSFRIRSGVLAAAELSGIAQRVVEMTNEYVKTRQQFGRSIGTFQAIQHKLSDMHLRAEQAQSLERFAAWAFDNDAAQRDSAGLAAKAFGGEVVPLLIEQSIQAHGGIGFTYEFELHHYLRRAIVLSKGFLPPGECQELLGGSFLSA